MTEQFKRLTEPFREDEIEWRIQQSGKGAKGIWAKVLAYVSARAIMDRLDEVVGPENWQDEYAPGPGGGVLCRLSLYFGDGLWICKQDVAENTDIEPIKGGVSGAFKRAAVKWGLGRYLYNLEEGWANVGPNGIHFAHLKDENGKKGESFKWSPPELPAWALPGGSGRPGNLLIPEKQKQQELPPQNDTAKIAQFHAGPELVTELYDIIKEKGGTEKDMLAVVQHFANEKIDHDNNKVLWSKISKIEYWNIRECFNNNGWADLVAQEPYIPF